jgi:hypothetical protein
VYGTAGTSAAAFVDYPSTGGVPDPTNPTTTQTGTFTTSANEELLTVISGAQALGC